MQTHQIGALSLLLLMQACAKHEPVLPPKVKINPIPKERYEVRVSLDQNPGDIAQVVAKISYRITNTNCIPVDYGLSIGGTRPILRHEVPLAVRDQNEFYSVVVFEDQLMDQDYYGLGICHWKFDGFGLKLERGPVTNIVGADLQGIPPGGVKTRRERCSYGANSAGENGYDACLMESAPLYNDQRKFFTATVNTRNLEK